MLEKFLMYKGRKFMTVEDLYFEIEGNYSDVVERFVTESKIIRFVLLFLNDGSYEAYIQAMQAEKADEAFLAIHTLKGVCLNLGFQGMYKVVNNITELLRANKFEEAKKKLPDLKAVYEKHINAIKKFLEETK